jgi:hypothetical protein
MSERKEKTGLNSATCSILLVFTIRPVTMGEGDGEAGDGET